MITPQNTAPQKGSRITPKASVTTTSNSTKARVSRALLSFEGGRFMVVGVAASKRRMVSAQVGPGAGSTGPCTPSG